MKTVQRTLISLTMLALLAGCSKGRSEGEPDAPPITVVPVKVAPIQLGNINQTVSANGQTEALHRETFVSPVAGTIVSLSISEGSVVKPGDVLVTILTRESQAAINGAEALVAAAATPERKIEAERALELAQSTQNLISIKAKSAGIVSVRSVVDGSVVAEGTDLFTVIDPLSIAFVAQVPLHDLSTVARGQAAAIRFPETPDAMLPAVIDAVSPQSDPQTQTVRVRLTFAGLSHEHRAHLKDGMGGMARIVTGAHTNVLLVPRPALLRNDETGAFTIVTVSDDSLSQVTPVTVPILTDSVVEVSNAELHEGMAVIVEGNYALADSTRVRVLR